MGENYAILRFQKMKRGSGIHGIEAHHERLKESYLSNPNIDMDRIQFDYHLIQPTEHYRQEIESRISKLNTRVRKDSVVCIDTIITSGPEFFQSKSPEETKAFFTAGCNFIAEKIGKENIISAVVHMDEKTPHLHLVFVPVTSDGRLSAKDIIGGKKGCVTWQNEFYDCMSKQYPELSRGRSVEETGHKHIEMSELRKSNKMNVIVNELEKSIDNTHPLNLPKQKKQLRKLAQELYPIGRDIEVTVSNIQERAKDAEERASVAEQDLSREAERSYILETQLREMRIQSEAEKREIKAKAALDRERLEADNRALQKECAKWKQELQRLRNFLTSLPNHIKILITEFINQKRQKNAPIASTGGADKAPAQFTMAECERVIAERRAADKNTYKPTAHNHSQQLIR